MDAILFDFDGVIIDSMSIRSLGFRTIFAAYPDEAVEALVDFPLANGGLSRFVKIRYFFETLLHQEISGAEVDAFARRYSEIMKAHLTDPGVIIEESLAFIRRMRGKQPMHVVSGSEEQELRYLCKELGLDAYFDSVHGSPTPKNELVAELMRRHGYRSDAVCLIHLGDGYIESFADFDLNGAAAGRYSTQNSPIKQHP